MNNPQIAAPLHRQWFTSSYSNGSGGECVECARTVVGTLVRDSKQPEGPVLTVEAGAWRAFLDGMVTEYRAP